MNRPPPPPDVPTTARGLAAMVLTTLEAQKRYFASRSTEDLRHAKEMERRLAAAARRVLDPHADLPFGDQP